MSQRTGKDLLYYKVTRTGVTVSFSGDVGHLPRTDVEFGRAMTAISKDDMDQLAELVLPSAALAKYSGCQLQVVDGVLFIDGRKLPELLATDVLSLYHAGLPYSHLYNFWKRLVKNPNDASVEQLYRFLRTFDLPLTPDGCFMAYKSVVRTGDPAVFTSHHDRHFKYRLGQPATEPRDSVSPDPHSPCASGLHVGSYQYAVDFGDGSRVLLLVVVDPADVVSVPHDCGYSKCRCCRLFPAEVTLGKQLSGRTYVPPIELGLDPIDDLVIIGGPVLAPPDNNKVVPAVVDDKRPTALPADNVVPGTVPVRIGHNKYQVSTSESSEVDMDGYRLLVRSDIPKFFTDKGVSVLRRRKNDDGRFSYIVERVSSNSVDVYEPV